MSTTPSRILRVGIIQGGKIIEERHFKKAETVSVGQDAKNTFVIPGSSLPSSFPVFEFKGGHYALCFTEGMDGKVRVGNSDVEFSQLKSQGVAKKRGDEYVVALDDQAKGKVTVGEVTLLFQFVQPPPEPVQVELPTSIKGGFWAGMDQLFFGILAVSLVLHFSGATCIALSPKPEEPELSLDQLPDRFAKVMMPPEEPKPPQQEEQQKGNEEKVEAKKDTGPKEKKQETPGDAAAKKAAIQQKVASKGLLKILGSAGDSGGALADVLGSSSGTGDIAAALQGAGGVGVATADAVAGGQKGGGTGNVAGIGDLGTSGGGNVNLGEKKEAAVSGRVKEAAPEVESSDVDRDALARYVKARLKAIQNCYEKELKRNPSLKGKVVVRFSITPAGRTGDIDIEENTLGNEAVGACIRTVIRGWVFPFKPDDSVSVAYPFVFSPAS